MCDCIKDINVQLKEYYNELGLVVESVVLPFLLGSKTYNEAEITFAGQRRRRLSVLQHNFCPFCGEPFDTETQK